MAVDLLFKKYIEKLRAHDPTCPLCHRPFDEPSEVDELISEVNFTNRICIVGNPWLLDSVLC
jgi:DNA repair exonuclease SbcCD ATPase subunit